MNNHPDDRSLLARAGEWASNTMTIAIEMAAPVLVGAWIDRWLGFKGLFSIIGGVIGMSAGIWSLLKLVEPLKRTSRRPPKQNEPPPKPPV